MQLIESKVSRNVGVLYKTSTLINSKCLQSIYFSFINSYIKVGLSPSKKICGICLIESPLKMMKNAFYFILKALFVLKIFKFLLRLFRHVGKTA